MVLLPVSRNVTTPKPTVQFVGDGAQDGVYDASDHLVKSVPQVPVREYQHIKGKLIIYCYDVSLYVILVSVVSGINPFLVFVCCSENVFG